MQFRGRQNVQGFIKTSIYNDKYHRIKKTQSEHTDNDMTSYESQITNTCKKNNNIHMETIQTVTLEKVDSENVWKIFF